MICEDEVRGALLCVQDFVRSPHFIQRNFFSDSGNAMLAESAAICDSITSSGVFEPWSHVQTASRSEVVAEVCACVNQAVDRRRAVKDSQEQWHAVGGIRPSAEDSTSLCGVRLSNTVEEGRVEYVPVSAPSISVPAPSELRVTSWKSKKKKISRSPVKRRFEIESPPPSSQHIVWLRIWFYCRFGPPAIWQKIKAQCAKPKSRSCFPGWIAIVVVISSPTLKTDLHSLICCCFVVICRLKLFCFFSVAYTDFYVVESFGQVKRRIIDEVNLACIEKKRILMNLVFVAVFMK